MVRAEAKGLHAIATHAGTGSDPLNRNQLEFVSPFESAEAWWRSLVGEFDVEHGGLHGIPKQPLPQLLWWLLEMLENNRTAPIVRVDTTGRSQPAEPAPGLEIELFLRTTLLRLLAGGIKDQLGPGFHRYARDARWITPHFEKPLPLNAQMAAVYARAARLLHEPCFLETAAELAGFAAAGATAQVDVVASDPDYYTWTSREVSASLNPRLVQVLGYHFHLTQHKAPHVLYRAVEPEHFGSLSHMPTKLLKQHLEEGKRELAQLRLQRTPPAPLRTAGTAWGAETIRWLFIAQQQGVEVDLAATTAALAILSRREDRGWLGDRAALLAATLAAYDATGDEGWFERASALADTLLRGHLREDGLHDWAPDKQLQTEGPCNSPSIAICDEVVPSAIATSIRSLQRLAQAGHVEAAEGAALAADCHLPAAIPCGARAAAYWQAWFVQRQDIKPLSKQVARFAPTETDTPA
jgi:uncharacterized protein YyaL (SSP411 family)